MPRKIITVKTYTPYLVKTSKQLIILSTPHFGKRSGFPQVNHFSSEPGWSIPPYTLTMERIKEFMSYTQESNWGVIKMFPLLKGWDEIFVNRMIEQFKKEPQVYTYEIDIVLWESEQLM